MTHARLTRRVFLPAALLLMAGCGGSQSPAPLPNAPAIANAPGAEISELIYASTVENKSLQDYVHVLSYPSAKALFKLGPFTQGASGGVPHALGLCTDPAGNVYIVDPGESRASQVYIYKHGARTVSRTLAAQYGSDECSVDPLSGDLAVLTNVGTVQIYRNASGKPQSYTLKHVLFPTYLAYGAGHQLYFAGLNNGGFGGLDVMGPAHHQHFVILDQRVPAGFLNLQWHAATLIGTVAPRAKVGQAGCVMQLKGYHGYVVQTFALFRNGKRRNFNDPDMWVQGNTAIAPGYGAGALDFWKFPQGGQPEREARIPGVSVGFERVIVSPPR